MNMYISINIYMALSHLLSCPDRALSARPKTWHAVAKPGYSRPGPRVARPGQAKRRGQARPGVACNPFRKGKEQEKPHLAGCAEDLRRLVRSCDSPGQGTARVCVQQVFN